MISKCKEYNRIVITVHQSARLDKYFLYLWQDWYFGWCFSPLIPRSWTRSIISSSWRLFCVKLLLIQMKQRCKGFARIISWKHNSPTPGRNGCHFADDNFLCIFVHEKVCIMFTILLKFASKGSIDNTRVLVQVMAWRRIRGQAITWTNTDPLNRCIYAAQGGLFQPPTQHDTLWDNHLFSRNYLTVTVLLSDRWSWSRG